MSFEVPERNAEVVVHGTLRIVGRELRIAGQCADALLISDTGAACHILESVADTDNREHEEVGAVL